MGNPPPFIDREVPVTASPTHILGKVNGFETSALWGGPDGDGHFSVHWFFMGEGERTLRVSRIYDDIADARYAFRCTREMIQDELKDDMLAAAQLPF